MGGPWRHKTQEAQQVDAALELCFEQCGSIGAKVSVGKPERFALLIDFDQFGSSSWDLAQQSVRERGILVESYLFGSPQSLASSRCKSSLEKMNITPIPVERKTGGA